MPTAKDPRTVALGALVALVVAAMIAGVVLQIVAPAAASASFAQIVLIVSPVITAVMLLLNRIQSTNEHQTGRRAVERIEKKVSSAPTDPREDPAFDPEERE